MSKVAIYLRLSDEDRCKRDNEESESIQNQRAMLMRHCQERGWEIYDIYSDEDYSGADSSRPQWNKMLRDCEQGKVDTVLCKNQSRFSRDMEMIEKYIHGLFLEWGVRFVGAVDNADTANKGNKKARQINGLVNEWYLEDISENIKSALHSKMACGEWVGSFAPYGYKRDPDNKNHLVVDPVAANVVREIFQMYRDGKGYVSICKSLNSRNILNPFLYKQASGSNFKTAADRATSKKWTDSTIYQILRREVYTGTLIQGTARKLSYKSDKRVRVPQEEWVRIPNAHQAIIEPELWEAVQRRISRHNRTEKFSGEIHVLSGKVFCGVCNNRMWKMSHSLAHGRYKYYKCKSTKVDTDLCHNTRSIRVDSLEEIVLSQINQMLRDYYSPDRIVIKEQHSGKADEQVKALHIERKDIQSRLSKREDHLAKLFEDKVKGLLTDEAFLSISRKFSSEIEQYEARLQEIGRQMEALTGPHQEDTTRDRNQVLSKYAQADALTRELVDEFIDAVYIGPLIQPEHQRAVEIRWRFA